MSRFSESEGGTSGGGFTQHHLLTVLEILLESTGFDLTIGDEG
jgi:hypothetical protein